MPKTVKIKFRMNDVTTPTRIKEEEHDADNDLDNGGDLDSGHSPVPVLKRCREPSDSPDIFTVPSPPVTSQAHHQLQIQHQSSQPPTFSAPTSPSPTSSVSDGDSWAPIRPTKRARHDRDDRNDASDGVANTTTDRLAPASNDTDRHTSAAAGNLDLNNAILRVHDAEGRVSTAVALAEFIPHEHAASTLITRFSWSGFLEWHHQSALGRRGSQNNREQPVVSRQWRGDNGTAVEDRFSWHVFLLEAAQLGGDAVAATGRRSGAQYIELRECRA